MPPALDVRVRGRSQRCQESVRLGRPTIGAGETRLSPGRGRRVGDRSSDGHQGQHRRAASGGREVARAGEINDERVARGPFIDQSRGSGPVHQHPFTVFKQVLEYSGSVRMLVKRSIEQLS